MLNDLRERGTIIVRNKEIKNIRELCTHLNVSSSTLYRWEQDLERKERIENLKPNSIELNHAKQMILSGIRKQEDEKFPEEEDFPGINGKKWNELSKKEKEALVPSLEYTKDYDYDTLLDNYDYPTIEEIGDINSVEKASINKSLELNLIKAIYANRFGSTTNLTKKQMVNKIIKSWKENKK